MLYQEIKFQVAFYKDIKDLNWWRQSGIQGRKYSMNNAQKEANNCGAELGSS